VLVAVNQSGGVFVFEENGQKLLHSYKHVSSRGSAKDLHLRGIASDGKETLFVGSGGGDILVLTLTKAKLALNKLIPASAEGHLDGPQGGGVSALTYASATSALVSGDDWGNICFWPAATADSIGAKPAARVEGKGSPVNVLASGQGIIGAGFASGHVRMLDPSKRALLVEIAAHTRSINALDIHASKPLLLAAAEDTFVTVWSIPSSSNPSVKSLSAESPALGLLTGARFGGQNQELIVTTIYDSRSLALMHTP
jgi:WD40 repeat protein